MSEDTTSITALTIDLVASYVGNHNIRPEDVPAFIASTHAAISGLTHPAPTEQESAASEHVPAVSARKSLSSPDHIISMIDGKPYKTLRRHLSTHGLTPDEYRQRYGLKKDYPMVSPTYSETRRSLAHKIGLGRKATNPAAAVGDAVNGAITKAAGTRKPRAKKLVEA